MAVDVAPVAPPNSRPIYRLIRRTRRLLRATWAVTGLAFTVGLLLGALAVVTAADLLLPLLQLPFWLASNIDTGLRLASLALVVAPPAAAFLIGVVFPLCRRLSAGQVARRIEAHIPGIHNRLVSCIDLESRGRAAASPVFYRRLLTESLQRIRGFRPGRVLDFLNLRRAGLTGVVGALAFVAVWLLFSDQLPTAMARIFQPFADIPPLSSVLYEVRPGDGKRHFLRDDKIDFAAEVKRGDAAGLRLQLQADNGAVRDFDLAVDPRRDPDAPRQFKLTLDSASIGPAFLNGFHYRVYGGGTWSPRYDLRLGERPLIKAVDTSVFYPAYMGIPEPHPTPAEASEIVGPEGSEIEVSVLAEGQVAVGEIQLLKPGLEKIPADKQEERVWFEDALPTGASEGGTWEHVKKGKDAAHTEPYAMGPHGHWFQGDGTGFTVQRGEVLFAYVQIDPQARPDEILLQWNDDKGWEHGAYWGLDLIHEGKSGTASRCPVDKAPQAGGWVRLEVPASKVGLEGKTVHGMAFKLSGGQVWWGKSGAVSLEKPTFVPDKTLHPFPMKSDGAGRWVGRVPLTGQGQFRPQLRNEQDDANTDVKELHYLAIKDQPPLVVLQQPGAELQLSKPQTTPLTIRAYDDYGLAEVRVLFFHESEKDPYQSRVLRHFDNPERSQTLVASLTETEALKTGAPLFYRIEVSDRKDQTARTPLCKVFLTDDANAADKQEEAFDKTQDTFRDRLLQLIAEQKKVQIDVDRLNTQYAEVTEKVRKDQEATQPPPPTDPTKPPLTPKDPPKIDPETAKKLADLQKELAQLAQQQDKNAQSAAQINSDLAKANDQAEKLQTLPQPLVEQMQALQQAFEQSAVKAMQNLTQQFNQGANPQAGTPDLKDLQHKGDRLEKDLEGLKDRMEALDNARKGLRDDLAKALQDLQREMLNANGKLSERDLQELRDFIAKMREQMKDIQNQQENLLNNAQKGGDLKDLEGKQADLDKQLDKMLEAARKMLDAKRNPNRRKPTFPDEPYTPDGDEVKVPPKESDTNEPLPNAKKPGDKKTDDKKTDKKDDDDDKEPLYMPALGGPKPVPDKRFDKKKRPVDKKPGDKDDPDADKRDDLESHQNDRLRDLDAAEKSLASDQQTLEQMMQALEKAMKGNAGQKPQKPDQNPGDPADDAMQQLAKMLQSPAMQQMKAMLARMQQGQAAKGQPQPNQPPGTQPPMPSQSPTSQNGNNPPVGSADLANLPPDVRAALLKLPPRLREELLQGRKERDPEGYAPFIEDYFKRLTESKNP